ncbi:flagellar motor protein MotB [Radiobacillus kanasensis]|uniref:flagellar motor protein MotB n=1 Tax=Radiobacillus kanasensis TaxID=2844358 RepID=UPI001E615CBA|nr:flagellar motor protein MotB [Radiobacillus kanasensis]UFT98313.1 flagellar motor protein MotB [Radiobacillus kanasensis]
MSKRGKKHKHEDHVDESWLLPYSDLLTLLVALFIVLYAMSEVDAKKFEALSEVFNEEFTSGTGIMENPSPVPEPDAKSLEEPEEKKEETSKEKDEKSLEEQMKERDKQELKELQAKINAYIKGKDLTAQLETSLTDEGLLVTIRDNVLFASGKADVREQDLQIAEEISQLLVINPPRNIIISGHTDNVPIRNSEFSSNWELSVMRAVNFMKILLENDQLDPQWFSAKGFGEFEPIASNDSDEGRSRNRRVEILILPRN